ncbi:uncharacterized protein LOC144946614 [Lampetra fluviatilis]
MADQREDPKITTLETPRRALCFQVFAGVVSVLLLVSTIVCGAATTTLVRQPEMAFLALSVALSGSVWLFMLWWYKSGVLDEGKGWLLVSLGLAAVYQALVSAVFAVPCPSNHTATTAAPATTTTTKHPMF